MNWLNEFDPFAAAWCRELAKAGHIPPCTVDERDIREVKAEEVKGYAQCHWFAGIVGWCEALRLAGWDATEPVWTGSCPCQPFSSAGKRKGTQDERHLWPEFLRLIAECRPPVVLGEQVASKDGRAWLAGVRADLEALGYAVGAADLCAAGVGAPHIRQRIFWVADSDRGGRGQGIEPRGLHEVRRGGTDERLPAPGAGALSTGGLADAGHDGGAARPARRQHESGTPVSQRAGGDSEVGGLADAQRPGVRHGRPGADGSPPRGMQGADGERQRLRADAGAGGGIVAGGLGHADGAGREARPPLAGADAARPEHAHQSGAGGWDRYAIVRCRDGKARRFESGSFPLVAGLPDGVVPGGDPGAPIREGATAEARVMRLRGYGNSIVPALAAQFIIAFMEATGRA